MNVFLFLKGELRQSKGVFFGLTVLLALALAVAVSVIQTERMVKSSTIRAAEQFDILVGARGSRSALLLGTVYLRDEMLSLVPMQVLDNLSPKTSDINWAAPLAFGDRAGKAALVGTTRVFVDQAGKRAPHHMMVAGCPGSGWDKPFGRIALKEVPDQRDDALVDGNGAVATGFGLFTADHIPLVKVDVLAAHIQELIDPHTGVDHDECNAGRVAQPLVVLHRPDFGDLNIREDPRLFGAGGGQLQELGIVLIYNIARHAPLAELAE